MLSNLAFALDSLLIDDNVLKGKIEGVTSNLIVFKTSGIVNNYTRLTSKEDMEDIIIYKPKLFSKELEQVAGHIYYIDSWNLKMYTVDGFLEIPRYRVVEIILKIR